MVLVGETLRALDLFLRMVNHGLQKGTAGALLAKVNLSLIVACVSV
jgi:hypothetical protein